MVVFWYFDLILDVPSLISYKCNRFVIAQSLIHSLELKRPDGGMCLSILVEHRAVLLSLFTHRFLNL